VRGEMLHLDPCIPRAWQRFDIVLRHRSARYAIGVENPGGVSRGVVRVELDGAVLAGNPPLIPLADDGTMHAVRVVLG
jgi:cyclic beta-1,2-glucan synthetase